MCVTGDAIPGLAYLRFHPNRLGRLTAREIFIDQDDTAEGITPGMLGTLPLSEIEAVVNEPRWAEHVLRQLEYNVATNGMSVLASYFRTSFGRASDPRANWVHLAYVSQGDESTREAAGFGDLKIPTKRRPRGYDGTSREADYRITQGPVDGLTDGFLRDVARAYSAAVARGERPNAAIAGDLGPGVPLRTVQRWVYEARRRGIMAPGRKGAAG